MNATTRARFEAKVDRSGGPEACWPWTGAKDGDGYGSFAVRRRARGAHVLALEEKLGRSLLTGYCALHECDNPACVNPAHLWEGTRAQNNADRDAKGRGSRGAAHGSKVRGERNGASVLTETIVREMRAQHGRGVSIAALARQRGLSETTTRRAVRRGSWKHVA